MSSVDDVLFGIAVVMLAIGGIVGIAYALDAHRKRHGPLGPALPRCGRVGRCLLWGARILVALMVLSVLGAYIFRAPIWVWVTLGCLVLFALDELAYQVVRLTGK